MMRVEHIGDDEGEHCPAYVSGLWRWWIEMTADPKEPNTARARPFEYALKRGVDLSPEIMNATGAEVNE
jgi:hypothetical protein